MSGSAFAPAANLIFWQHAEHLMAVDTVFPEEAIFGDVSQSKLLVADKSKSLIFM